MWEKENVRMLQRLIDVSVRHKLLIGKSFIGFFFLILCNYSWRNKFWCLSDYFRYYNLEMPNCFIHHYNSLKGSNDKISQIFCILICNWIYSSIFLICPILLYLWQTVIIYILLSILLCLICLNLFHFFIFLFLCNPLICSSSWVFLCNNILKLFICFLFFIRNLFLLFL